jgi:hypothetical protein
MRSNQNPSGSGTRSVGARGVGEQGVEQPNLGQRSLVAKLSMPQMPVEWLDAGSWRLPSGKALAEFALQAGFLAPLLFRTDGVGKSALNRSITSTTGNESPARGKQFGKGDGR